MIKKHFLSLFSFFSFFFVFYLFLTLPKSVLSQPFCGTDWGYADPYSGLFPNECAWNQQIDFNFDAPVSTAKIPRVETQWCVLESQSGYYPQLICNTTSVTYQLTQPFTQSWGESRLFSHDNRTATVEHEFAIFNEAKKGMFRYDCGSEQMSNCLICLNFFNISACNSCGLKCTSIANVTFDSRKPAPKWVTVSNGQFAFGEKFKNTILPFFMQLDNLGRPSAELRSKLVKVRKENPDFRLRKSFDIKASASSTATCPLDLTEFFWSTLTSPIVIYSTANIVLQQNQVAYLINTPATSASGPSDSVLPYSQVTQVKMTTNWINYDLGYEQSVATNIDVDVRCKCQCNKIFINPSCNKNTNNCQTDTCTNIFFGGVPATGCVANWIPGLASSSTVCCSATAQADHSMRVYKVADAGSAFAQISFKAWTKWCERLNDYEYYDSTIPQLSRNYIVNIYQDSLTQYYPYCDSTCYQLYRALNGFPAAANYFYNGDGSEPEYLKYSIDAEVLRTQINAGLDGNIRLGFTDDPPTWGNCRVMNDVTQAYDTRFTSLGGMKYNDGSGTFSVNTKSIADALNIEVKDCGSDIFNITYNYQKMDIEQFPKCQDVYGYLGNFQVINAGGSFTLQLFPSQSAEIEIDLHLRGPNVVLGIMGIVLDFRCFDISATAANCEITVQNDTNVFISMFKGTDNINAPIWSASMLIAAPATNITLNSLPAGVAENYTICASGAGGNPLCIGIGFNNSNNNVQQTISWSVEKEYDFGNNTISSVYHWYTGIVDFFTSLIELPWWIWVSLIVGIIGLAISILGVILSIMFVPQLAPVLAASKFILIPIVKAMAWLFKMVLKVPKYMMSRFYNMVTRLRTNSISDNLAMPLTELNETISSAENSLDNVLDY